jgi:hypothetical protein
VIVVLVSGGGAGPSLAARAYAATAPGDHLYYTETTTETRGGAAPPELVITKVWQYRDRMHDTMDVYENGRHDVYEHDQRGGVFRTLHDGKLDVVRRSDPAWKGRETDQVFRMNVSTVIENYRREFARNKLRDAGETTFAGRPARAYEVLGEPAGQTLTFYIDAETALPLGTVYGLPGGMTITEIVKRFERLATTAQNLAKLTIGR